MQPRRIIVAVPVGAVEACAAIAREADEVICGRTPQPFYAVGSAYERFGQLTDEDVRRLLDAAR
jgi:predicted phosphoribosyltransferase